jgi:hypothetical protein
MTRLQKLASLYLSIFGEEPTASKLHDYANMNESIPLEVLSSLMISNSGNSAEYSSMNNSTYLLSMFKSVFNLSTEEINQIRSTDEGAAGFQYWVNELDNNPYITKSTLPIALINGTSDTSALESNVANIISNYNYNYSSSTSIAFSVGNMDSSANYNDSKPLEDIPFTEISFSFDSEVVTLDLDVDDVNTYDDFWDALVSAANTDDNINFYIAMLLGDVSLSRSEGTHPFFSLDGELRYADGYYIFSEEHTISASNTIFWTASAPLTPDNSFLTYVSENSLSAYGREVLDIDTSYDDTILLGINNTLEHLDTTDLL